MPEVDANPRRRTNYIHWGVRGLDVFKEMQYIFEREPEFDIKIPEIPGHTTAPIDLSPTRNHCTTTSFYGDRHPRKNLSQGKQVHIIGRIVTAYDAWIKDNDLPREYCQHEFGIHHETMSEDFMRPDKPLRIHFHPSTPAARLRWFIKDRFFDCYDSSSQTDSPPQKKRHDPREQRAWKILLGMVGRDAFRQYLKRGKLPIKAKSGKTYLLTSNAEHMPVYVDNKEVEKVCLVSPLCFDESDFCPTDLFLLRYILLMADEERFNTLANHHATIIPTHLEYEPADAPYVEHYLGRERNFARQHCDIRPLPEVLKAIRSSTRIKVFEELPLDVRLVHDPSMHLGQIDMRAIPGEYGRIESVIMTSNRSLQFLDMGVSSA